MNLLVVEVFSTGRLRLLPLLVVVLSAVVESAGFLSACSLAWSFFQLLDRSVVVFPGMTGTMSALLVVDGGNIKKYGIGLLNCRQVNFFGKGKPRNLNRRGPRQVHGPTVFYGRNNEQDALNKYIERHDNPTTAAINYNHLSRLTAHHGAA